MLLILSMVSRISNDDRYLLLLVGVGGVKFIKRFKYRCKSFCGCPYLWVSLLRVSWKLSATMGTDAMILVDGGLTNALRRINFVKLSKFDKSVDLENKCSKSMKFSSSAPENVGRVNSCNFTPAWFFGNDDDEA